MYLGVCFQNLEDEKNLHPSGVSNPNIAKPVSDGSQNFAAKKRQKTLDVSSLSAKKMKHYIDKVDSQENSHLNEAFLKFLISCNLNFEIILNNTYFKNFLNLIRPAYKIPSKQEMLKLLEKISFDKKFDDISSEDNFHTLMISRYEDNGCSKYISYLQCEKRHIYSFK